MRDNAGVAVVYREIDNRLLYLDTNKKAKMSKNCILALFCNYSAFVAVASCLPVHVKV